MTASPMQITPIRGEKLHPDPHNRPDRSGEEDLHGLAATIRVLGILEPMLVEEMPARPGHYVIRAGHRRKAAGELAGLNEFPCIVRRPLKGATDAVTGSLYAVVENFQRNAMSPVELALRLGQLLDEGMTQAQIARFTGMKEPTISYHLELLDLTDEELNKVRKGPKGGGISVGAAHDYVQQARAAALQPGQVMTLRPQKRPARRGQQARRPRPHFSAGHPLAPAASALCLAYRHEAWTRIGKVACGPCFEEAIVAAATPEPGEILASLGLTLDDLTPAALRRIGMAPAESRPARAPVPATAFSAGGSS
jgi:ParB/RepB/Spo0J family partition protein